MANDRLNNAQRKALVEIVSEIMERKVQKAESAKDRIEEEKKKEVRQELGVDEIDEQIKELEKKIKALNDRKQELGFGTYGSLRGGSEAQELLDEKLSDTTQRIRSLKLERSKLVSSIWTAEHLSEAKELIDSVLNQE